MRALTGGVFGTTNATDDFADLRRLAEDIGMRSFDERIGHRNLPDGFDHTAWRHLEDAGLTRLTSDPESGGSPSELALILRALARHAVTVPLAETDVLAGWLATRADIQVPDTGPLTLALGDAGNSVFDDVPYAGDADAVVFALRDGGALQVAVAAPAELIIAPGHNLGGEPRDTVQIDLPAHTFVTVDAATELDRRGAWARCIQALGALDAAVEYSVAHTRDRVQFGRPLSAFQAVQHTLATMAGEVERARAAAELAVAAAADHGFDSAQADYGVTVAKVVLGRVVPAVVTAAHQLHGAIGVTIEHRLWLATMRARSW
ncbi:MAG TPA: acyl-CoA dehydrogenase family protein, partial [Mycobacterium sp.]|nr:acyl-CoA dehydrogenase family protein [Mycobacterium sp.]